MYMHNSRKFKVWLVGGLTALGVTAFYGYSVHAHVQYVIPREALLSYRGSDTNFLFSQLQDPTSLAIILGGLVIGVILVAFLKKSIGFVREISFIREEAESYHDLIPWMIRLSLGIALIGAGIGGSLISPVVGATALESFLEILAGFLFLSGFLLFPACIISLALFSLMVGKDPLSFVGTLNVLALLIIFLIKGNPKPGVDAILGFPTFRGLLKFDSFSPLILRVGTGVCFFSLALYEKLLNPHWSEYVVHLYNLQSIVPVSPAMWVLGAGVTELLLGILLILGFQTRMVAAVSLIVLSLSFFFFKEQVYSHITLFGALSILFVTGAARVSIDAHFRKR